MKNKISDSEFQDKAADITAALGGRFEPSGIIVDAAPFDIRTYLGYSDGRLHFSAHLWLTFPDGGWHSANEFTPWNNGQREFVPDKTSADFKRPSAAIAKQVRGMIDKVMPYWDLLQREYQAAVEYKQQSESAISKLEALLGVTVRHSESYQDMFYIDGFSGNVSPCGDKITIGGMRYISMSPENAAKLIKLLIEVRHE